MTPDMKQRIKEALEDYSRPYSTTDEGNLYFCATETMKAYEEMQKKVKPLVEALRFYADKNNWYANGAIGLHDLIVKDDLSQDDCLRWVNQHGGKRAREALKGWEG